MSLATSITLDAADGTDVVFVKTRTDASGSTYIDQSTTLSSPNMLSFKHSINGKGADAVDRHLIQIQKNVLNASGQLRVLTANFTLAVPRDTAVTQAMVRNAVSNIIDFLADGSITSLATTSNIDAILRGES